MNNQNIASENNDKQLFLLTSEEEVLCNKDERKVAYWKIEQDLKNAISWENVIILSGAWTSISNTESKWWKTMVELWDTVKQYAFDFNKILQIVSDDLENTDFIKEKNLEELLSRLKYFEKMAKYKEEDIEKITDAINEIEKIIKNECSFELPKDFPHETFLRKLLKLRKKTLPRVKIFTLNYDKCFEQAWDNIWAVVNDWFSFSQLWKFKTTNFDLDIVYREQTRIHNEENFYDKVFHLYKIHWSVDWEEKNWDIYKNKLTDKPLLIYPNSSKYESSYEMPFFEMISRFQNSLRKQNTYLFIIWYWFWDNHINRIIKEAIKTNINLNVFIISPSIKEDKWWWSFREELYSFAKKNNWLTLIADNFTNFTNNLPNINIPDSNDERDFENNFN